MLRQTRCVFVVVGLLSAAAFGQGVVCEQNPEFSANVFSAGDQARPALGVTGDGVFVVVWQSLGSFGDDSDGDSVQARRFASNRQPLDATEFQVNTTTSASQHDPALSVAEDGSFIVAWSSQFGGA